MRRIACGRMIRRTCQDTETEAVRSLPLAFVNGNDAALKISEHRLLRTGSAQGRQKRSAEIEDRCHDEVNEKQLTRRAYSG